MSDVVVRAGVPADAARLAALKVVWANRAPAKPDDLTSFAEDLASWMYACGDSLIARVAEHQAELIGMAWLIIFERVPDIADRHRLTGDIQSVFVLPEFRHKGVGSSMIKSLLDAADEQHISRITVSSNAAATPLYRAAGFESVPWLLERRWDPDLAR